MADDTRHSRISLMAHLGAGAALGAASPFLGRALYAATIMIMVAFILGKLTQRMTSRKMSWWAANGLFIYVFTWLDMWIFAANML